MEQSVTITTRSYQNESIIRIWHSQSQRWWPMPSLYYHQHQCFSE